MELTARFLIIITDCQDSGHNYELTVEELGGGRSGPGRVEQEEKCQNVCRTLVDKCGEDK